MQPHLTCNEIYSHFGDGRNLDDGYAGLKGLNAGLIASAGAGGYNVREIVAGSTAVSITNGTGLMNPSVYNDNGKIIVNLRHVNYTFYHSEKKTFQHQWGPLTYVHPENDMHLRTTNYYLEMDDNLDIARDIIK